MRIEACLDGVREGTLIPYLGAGVSALVPGVPASPAALSAAIEAEVRVPRRAAGNMWAAAQFVESRRFRATLSTIVEKAFDVSATGNPVHDWIGRLRPPMVVDAWYDDGLIETYRAGPGDWGWVQGVSRNGEWIEIWTRAYAPDGTLQAAPDPGWGSLVYKPHGMARKGSSFLMSDSDYVEVLTEIDIQTPIPAEVKARRTGRGFLFLGCRFDDQMLRTFARQIMKRSGGVHVAVIEGALTRMEARFLEEQGIVRIDAPIAAVVEAIAAPA